jgi:phosphoenolpyruvate carboxylase
MFEMIHPLPEHFAAIQELCRRVYPFTKPWSLEQLEAHHSYFPDGQLLVVEKETGKVIGLAFSLIISWDDYSPQDNWQDFTSSGFFHNHNPKKGKTLYGAEVMVDPEYRGRGIGKMLYRGRTEIARRYRLKRIRAGARLRGYSKYEDKYTPEEYVKRVYEKEIFDPTLSFQLNQGFVPLDVARNYLFNDPESLGYAAVIEWLNPEIATERDFKRQQENVAFFLLNQRLNVEHLPKELRRLVRKTTFLLGQMIKEKEGPAFLDKIESYRKSLKPFRTRKNSKDLEQIAAKLSRESAADQLKIAHAFSLLLEIVNACESAYRTWRQRQKALYPYKSSPLDLIFVLTAHPTEARSPLVISFIRRISDLLLEGLQNNFVFQDDEIRTHLRALLAVPLVKTKTPSVVDEAEAIFSIVFHPPIFDFILSQSEPYRIRLRTWVGGDKDGHPGVNAAVMVQCLSLSRKKLIRHLEKKLTLVSKELEDLSSSFPEPMTAEKNGLKNLSEGLKPLRQLEETDGKNLDQWARSFEKFQNASCAFVAKHHQILLIQKMLELFPGLVLPIELREDAGKIKEAVKNPEAPIARMLTRLHRLAKGSPITHYARGLVISHCEEAEDMENALKLCAQCGLKSALPVIPLFESREALTQADKILFTWLEKEKHLEKVRKDWEGELEVMLGYSDSAKEVGVLPSRALIRAAMNRVSRLVNKHQLIPVFFHGSGGSVARGGGSLREQVSWWPSAAAKRPKLTLQGEMIQRTFATKEILNSQGLHFVREIRLKKPRSMASMKAPKAFEKMRRQVEHHYRNFVDDPELLGTALRATPYGYLDVLKIGSRPTQRPSQKASVGSLRAIPWVLCWTQTRVLFPTWWGVGSAWQALSETEKQELKHYFESNAFFSSFIKQLGFTLAKVELFVWRHYLKAFDEADRAEKMLKLFEDEYKKAVAFCLEVSGKQNLLWHRPWLGESIKLRAPYIHLLNLLQINAMKTDDEPLLKETLVGIACGMLTTG